MPKKPLIAIALLLLAITSYSQNFSLISKTFPSGWKILEVPSNVNRFMNSSSAYSYKKSIIYLNEHEAVISGFDEKKGFEIIRVNKDAAIKWQVALPGYAFAIARRRNKIIAFCTKGVYVRLYAVLIDMETGEKLGEKSVYQSLDGDAVDPKVLVTTTGEFKQLLVRKTRKQGQIHYPLESKSINAIAIDDEMTPVSNMPLESAAIGGLFIGTATNKSNETFIASIQENDKKIVIERFDAEMQLIDKIETPLAYKDKDQNTAKIEISSSNDQSLLVIMNANVEKERSLCLYEFNFNSKKVASLRQPLNGDYNRQIKEQAKTPANKPMSFDDMGSFHLVDVLQTPDKIIVIQEERYARGPITFRNDGVLVSVYDRNLKLLNNLALDKKFEYQTQAQLHRSLGSHVQGERLIVSANAGIKSRNHMSIFYTLDLKTMAVNQFTNDSIFGEHGSMLWFKDAALLGYVGDGNCVFKIGY